MAKVFKERFLKASEKWHDASCMGSIDVDTKINQFEIIPDSESFTGYSLLHAVDKGLGIKGKILVDRDTRQYGPPKTKVIFDLTYTWYDTGNQNDEFYTDKIKVSLAKMLGNITGNYAQSFNIEISWKAKTQIELITQRCGFHFSKKEGWPFELPSVKTGRKHSELPTLPGKIPGPAQNVLLFMNKFMKNK
jgi:hypothetical protein